MVVLVTVILLLDSSAPGQLLGFTGFYFLPAFICLFSVALDYVFRLVAVLAKQIQRHPVSRITGEGGQRKRWLVTPCCALLLASMILYPWPARIRFWLSRPAFERAVMSGSTSRDWTLVGLFIVRHITVHPNGVVFFSTGLGILGEHGFVFGPAQPSITDAAILVNRPIAPSWYIGELDW